MLLFAAILLSIASAQVPVQQAFVESVADRLGVEAAGCDPEQSDIATDSATMDVEIYCFDHDYPSIERFATAWSEAAEWDGVFVPEPQFEQGLGAYPQLSHGMWLWFSELMRMDGMDAPFEAHLTRHLLNATEYGYQGKITTLFYVDEGYGQLMFLVDKDPDGTSDLIGEPEGEGDAPAASEAGGPPPNIQPEEGVFVFDPDDWIDLDEVPERSDRFRVLGQTCDEVDWERDMPRINAKDNVYGVLSSVPISLDGRSLELSLVSCAWRFHDTERVIAIHTPEPDIAAAPSELFEPHLGAVGAWRLHAIVDLDLDGNDEIIYSYVGLHQGYTEVSSAIASLQAGAWETQHLGQTYVGGCGSVVNLTIDHQILSFQLGDTFPFTPSIDAREYSCPPDSP